MQPAPVPSIRGVIGVNRAGDQPKTANGPSHPGRFSAYSVVLLLVRPPRRWRHETALLRSLQASVSRWRAAHQVRSTRSARSNWSGSQIRCSAAAWPGARQCRRRARRHPGSGRGSPRCAPAAAAGRRGLLVMRGMMFDVERLPVEVRIEDRHRAVIGVGRGHVVVVLVDSHQINQLINKLGNTKNVSAIPGLRATSAQVIAGLHRQLRRELGQQAPAPVPALVQADPDRIAQDRQIAHERVAPARDGPAGLEIHDPRHVVCRRQEMAVMAAHVVQLQSAVG